MDVLSAIAEIARVWIEGGSWADIRATDGFATVALLAAWLIPSTLIALAIGLTHWHETPLGIFLGARGEDQNWAERARDLDKDGSPDF